MHSEPDPTPEALQHALGELTAVCDDYRAARSSEFNLRVAREEALVTARRAGVPLHDIARASGLSLPRISQLTAGAAV